MKLRVMRSAIGGVGTCLGAMATVAACTGGTATMGSPGGNCANVSPCGGNIVGTWKIANFCATGATGTSNPPPCSGQSEQINVTGISGTLTFNSDGTYTETVTTTESTVLSVGMNCTSDGGTVSCGQLGMTESTAVGAAVSCVANGPNCDCDLPSSTTSSSGSGMYSTSGTSLTTTPASGTTSTVQYCVQGTALSFVVTSGMGGGAMGADNASLTFVLTKQ